MTETARISPSRVRHVLAALALLATAAVVHWRLPSFWFYSDDFALLVQSRDRSLEDWWSGLFAFETYWRPGQQLLFDGVFTAFGPSAPAYCSVALAMHLAVVAWTYALGVRATGSAWIGGLVGGCLLLAPAALELVYFTAATTNCTFGWFLLMPAGVAAMVALESGPGRFRRMLWVVAGALFVASVTCREYAYHFPLMVFGSSVVLRRDGFLRAGLRALPFGLVIVLHFLFFTASGSGAEATPGWRGIVELVREFATVTYGGTRGVLDLGFWPLLVSAAILALGLAQGSPRTRALVWWAIVAAFPYVFRSYTDRYAYPFLTTSLLAIGCTLHGAAVRVGGAWLARVLLLALAGFLAVGLWPARDREFTRGETCRRTLAWCEAEGLAASVDHIAVDSLPEPLLNGWPGMLELFGTRRLEVAPLSLVPDPPFGLLLVGALPPADRTAFVRVDSTGVYPRYERVEREDFVGGLLEIPMFGFVRDWVVEPDDAAALRRDGGLELARVVPLSAAPEGLKSVPDAEDVAPRPLGWMVDGHLGPPPLVFEIEVEVDCVFVLAVPGGAALLGAPFELDGVRAAPLRACGRYPAFPLAAGRHRLVVPAK